jgi:hypothetical protein
VIRIINLFLAHQTNGVRTNFRDQVWDLEVNGVAANTAATVSQPVTLAHMSETAPAENILN